MPKLVVFRGRRKEGTFDLRGRVVIGRSSECDVRLDNPLVSRRHAEILYSDGAWRVQDLDTGNGLYVNGSRINSAQLKIGDTIEIGRHHLRFASDQSELHEIQTIEELPTATTTNEATAILPPIEIESIQRHVQRRLESHVVLSAPGIRQREIQLDKERYVVGWAADCDIRLPGSVLLGKRPAELVRGPGGSWRVVSLSSLATVRVGGERVAEHLLQDGDVIEIKDVELTFKAEIAELVVGKKGRS